MKKKKKAHVYHAPCRHGQKLVAGFVVHVYDPTSKLIWNMMDFLVTNLVL